MSEDSKFIREAVTKGVSDIVASYSAAIDKFVADPDVRLAIKMSAGAGIMQRIFARLTETEEAPVQEESKPVVDTTDSGKTPPPFGDISSWVEGKF